MSAVKIGYQPYKLFEPHYHPERPIIVDADALESPDTVTLRYEEEAARASGGSLRGDSPPGLLSMNPYPKSQPPQMHAFDGSRPYQDTTYQYPTHGHGLSSPQPENAAAQLNQMAFAANSSAASYIGPVVPTVSCFQPDVGVGGTKLVVKISSPYDLMSLASHFLVAFASQKCVARINRDTHDTSGCSYVVSVEAPHFDNQGNTGGSVPLSLMIESPEGHSLGNVDVGTFTYHVAHTQGSSEGVPEDVTRKSTQSPEQRHSPAKEETVPISDSISNSIPETISETAAANTNSYGYPPAAQTSSTGAPSFDATYTNPGANSSHSHSDSMLSSYHRNSYAADFTRTIPPPLKAPSSYSSYGSSLGSARSSGLGQGTHTTIARSSTTSLPAPSAGQPLLVRTSTLHTSASSHASHGQYSPYGIYPTKAVLKIQGDLDNMTQEWTREEWENKRRIVLFNKRQSGSTLNMNFRPVSVNERPANSICISCIWWAEKGDWFVTSVDTISLLEQLVLPSGARFQVEEKNRIRRNLEGFRPMTVSKAKPDSEDFFRTIMGFPHPKPRNIEKDVKVFPWRILSQALKKIIGKYSASTSSTVPHMPALLPPGSGPSPGLYPPPQTPSVGDYSQHSSHTLTSPRSFAGTGSSWGSYSGGRALSPGVKSGSPTGTHMRMPSLSSYATVDARHGASSSYSLASQPHGRWDATVSSGYSDTGAIPAYTSHHHHQHQHHHPSQVYGTGVYGDASQRT